MSITKDLRKYIKTWDEGSTGYFKVAPVKLSVTTNATDLEQQARETARDIEAEVSYAWDLGDNESESWWLEWGGYDLEEEIPFLAAISLPEAEERLKTFDPDDNEFECETEDEYKLLLFNAFDEDLKAKDLERGFRLWLESLDQSVLQILKKDLESWTSRAK